ncbi:MAG: signal recognition particle-docking protein FtsY [Actinomycetota bacterium]|nr:signal recognition particle-docking protein FtsY [Actinomycetota bacterium]
METVIIIVVLLLVLGGGFFFVSSSSKKKKSASLGTELGGGREAPSPGSLTEEDSAGPTGKGVLTEPITPSGAKPLDEAPSSTRGELLEAQGDDLTLAGAAGEVDGDGVEAQRSLYVAQAPSSDLNGALARTKGGIGSKLSGLFKRTAIDESFYEELEEALILSDVGVEVTMKIVEDAKNIIRERKVKDPAAALDAIREAMAMVMSKRDRSLHASLGPATVWLFVGVNGVGKTTTIGKVANRYSDKKLLLAAGDTFRAAASDQLTIWADRASVPVVQGTPGADPSSVIFDAISSGRARGSELILCDTAGRLQNKTNLIEELKKIYRTVEKAEGILGEVLLVLDATTGQNGLSQAKIFSEAVGVTGVVLTKLDGSAKGGIAFAIEETLNIPVKLVGVGEAIGDLIDFDPVAYVESLTQVE